jgi:hypothetical protein
MARRLTFEQYVAPQQEGPPPVHFWWRGLLGRPDDLSEERLLADSGFRDVPPENLPKLSSGYLDAPWQRHPAGAFVITTGISFHPGDRFAVSREPAPSLSSLPRAPKRRAVTDMERGLDRRFRPTDAGNLFPLWAPGDPILQQGRWLLVGVAAWSAHDVPLLDAVSQAIQGRSLALAVSVFNVANCMSPRAFEAYIPGIGSVFHTPVVGLWSDGKLVEKASGKAGRDLVARVCGLDR